MAEVYDAIARMPRPDFSWIAQLPGDLELGQQRGAQDALRSAFAGGLPRTASGDIDWDRAVNLAAQTGNISSLRDLAATVPFANIMQTRAADEQFAREFGGQRQPATPQPT